MKISISTYEPGTHELTKKFLSSLISSRGGQPLACLNAMLNHNSKTDDSLFYKMEGHSACFGLRVSSSFAFSASCSIMCICTH